MTLELKSLSIVGPGKKALFEPVSCCVEAGQIVTIMGPSGVGKSTLLDAIGGHLAHDFTMQGRVILGGRDVSELPPEARRIGIMFQDAVLFPHLSVGDNLAFGLRQDISGGAARRDAVETALEQAGLSGMYDRDPATLSGGQRARAALMQALLAEPRALLLDEPFSRLDVERRGEIREFTFKHVMAKGVPTIMVTHDPDDACAAGGPVIQLGAPQS
jgi:putative thiamine transport system ATP-binding protein